MGDFDGLVAVVTGNASGIGAATAALLASRGATVAGLDVTTGCDVTSSESVDAGIAAVVQEHGRIDVVVNNAGIGAQGDVAANSDDEWRRVLDVNVLGVARVTRAALPHLRRSPSAAVVNLSSIVAAVGMPNRALYSASKGAVTALTLAMAADHVHDGIRVTAVIPGTADTPWVGRLLDSADDPDAARTALVARQPIGRLVSADEVANAIVYLASPLSGSTTGTLLQVDGGVVGIRVPPRPS